jgi:hypothetical protein
VECDPELAKDFGPAAELKSGLLFVVIDIAARPTIYYRHG